MRSKIANLAYRYLLGYCKSHLKRGLCKECIFYNPKAAGHCIPYLIPGRGVKID